jgi:hypothetical protein
LAGTPPDPGTEAQAARTLAEIAALSRAPFRRLLSRFMQAGPSLEALADQADRYPDRWAQGLAIAGRLAGYSERLDVDVSGEIQHVHQLSDLALEAEIQELEARLSTLHTAPHPLPPHDPA